MDSFLACTSDLNDSAKLNNTFSSFFRVNGSNFSLRELSLGMIRTVDRALPCQMYQHPPWLYPL